MSDETLQPMDITLEQQKIISHPFRVEIIILLSEQPMTSKQVADRLDKDPGTTYYHIQQLFKHEILELVHTEVSRGIVEKFYRAKATLFRVNDSELQMKRQFRAKRDNYIMLSEAELAALSDEISELFYKYTQQSLTSKQDRTAYQISFEAKEYDEGEIT
ncbi:ArsR/SmtB family transcription factor [Paenibacillus tundrae]|uniref:DNA-binding transcriptional ArsR family regulator n=1 Tax=Paenibacillus tundrae TaxID=528187 RepID=A0ABT9WJW7_9BACL|nr:helix-turn-helix domain-containing protein [Paenibacillus tundrae]MDQ0173463.1 DNA-binding transcriptional ArsR family regulator [Paenibacillus tundrae]